MRLSAAALLLTVLISSFSPGHGVLEAYNTNLKCRCMGETSSLVRINRFDRLQVRAPGHGCPNTEIMVQRKNKSVVCLNPAANWVQKLITVLQKRNLLSTAPAPVMKRAA
ncbi:C-X-C motif chemokine 13 [Heterocephalus glaber]|uniref:C-X-C motif chemokine 13 n=1 Tax=Heterocephalus glaber TaxID=10181 RepID=A0A0N8EUQ7_HETGA|nr:C-X-C motif chemokine 13 [Heterocephalus glaber]